MWDSPARQAGAAPGAGPTGDGARALRAPSAWTGQRAQAAPLSVRLSGGTLELTPVRRLLASSAYPAHITTSVTPDVSQCQTTSENGTQSCQNGFVETQGAPACHC